MAGSKIAEKNIKYIRLFYENFNGVNIAWKTRRLNTLNCSLGIDILCGTECNSRLTTGETWALAKKVVSNTPLTTYILASNKNENFGRKQRGEVMVAAGGHVGNCVMSSGVDTSDLGRCAWVRIEAGSRPACIITAYQPCRSRKDSYGTSYTQHWRFWLGKGVTTFPRKLFLEHLRDQLIEWRQNGGRILLLIETNEEISDGHLQRIFS